MPADPFALLARRRPIRGISATLLPYTDAGEIDWPGFRRHLERTAAAGLFCAVNMDTGYGNLLRPEERRAVLAFTRATLGGAAFYAGAFVRDRPGDAFDRDGYRRDADQVQEFGGSPVIVQSFGLTRQPDDAILASYEQIAEGVQNFVAFELGTMFAPFGQIYSLDVFRGLMAMPKCEGAKHSSLRRELEWERLALRNATRSDFRVYTGNDLAIDMVMYGSDYLLGLSTFAPDLFAARDRAWEAGDPSFFERNDWLQYLGAFAFREPVPAYKHSAAQFLMLRGQLESDAVHPDCPRRPAADHEVLRAMLAGLA